MRWLPLDVRLAALALVAVTGCSSPAASGPVSVHAVGDLSAADPCAVLTASERADLSLSDGGPDPSAPRGQRGCGFSSTRSGDKEAIILFTDPAAQTVRTRLNSIGPNSTVQKADVAIDAYPAIRISGTGNSGPLCNVLLDLGDQGIVSIGSANGSTGRGTADEVCDEAQDLARTVFPKLASISR